MHRAPSSALLKKKEMDVLDLSVLNGGQWFQQQNQLDALDKAVFERILTKEQCRVVASAMINMAKSIRSGFFQRVCDSLVLFCGQYWKEIKADLKGIYEYDCYSRLD